MVALTPSSTRSAPPPSSVFLGERLDVDGAWPAAPTAPAALLDPPEYEPSAAAARDVAPRHLGALAWEIERAPNAGISLMESQLPEALCCRTALEVLTRRARRREKQLALADCTLALRPIATGAGWTVDRPTRARTRDSEAQSAVAIASDAGSPTPAAAARTLSGGARAYGGLIAEVAPLRRPKRSKGPAEQSTGLGLGRFAAVGALAATALPWAQTGRLTGFRSAAPRLLGRLQAVQVPALRLPARPATLPRVRVPLPASPTRLPLVMALGGVAGIMVLALILLLLPGATVTLVPAKEDVALDLPVVVDPGIKKADLTHARLPGRAIDKEVSETAQAPATGRKPSPDARAGGEVVFVNKTDKPVVVPKGTVVLAGSVRFATQADVNIGGTVFSGPQQRISMQRAQVLAVIGGVEGNVGRFQINKIEGPLANQLDVQNDAAMKGGSEKTITFVTADDRRKLQESLTKTLTDRLNQQIKSQLPAPDKETAVPWGATNPTVVEAAFNKNEGDEAQTLSLTLKIRYGATVFGNDAYNNFVKQLAAARAGAAKPGYDVAAGSIQALPPSVDGVENGAIRLQAHARATAWPHVDTAKLRAAIVNQPVRAASASLATIPGVTEAHLKSGPSWFGRTPLLGWRIAIRTVG
jgi:hypothetical protein